MATWCNVIPAPHMYVHIGYIGYVRTRERRCWHQPCHGPRGPRISPGCQRTASVEEMSLADAIGLIDLRRGTTLSVVDVTPRLSDMYQTRYWLLPVRGRSSADIYDTNRCHCRTWVKKSRVRRGGHNLKLRHRKTNSLDGSRYLSRKQFIIDIVYNAQDQ